MKMLTRTKKSSTAERATVLEIFSLSSKFSTGEIQTTSLSFKVTRHGLLFSRVGLYHGLDVCKFSFD
jgi:hypothetical protein